MVYSCIEGKKVLRPADPDHLGDMRGACNCNGPLAPSSG
jgi:hypothetical protein